MQNTAPRYVEPTPAESVASGLIPLATEEEAPAEMITLECECPDLHVKFVEKFEKAPVMLSKVISTMFEDLGGEIQSDVAIPVPVSRATMIEVVRYCKQALIIPPNITPPEYLHIDVHPWEKEFFEGYDNRMLFDIVIAANVLDIKSLFDASAMFIGMKLKNCVPEEIRKEYNITRVFTPEEEESLLQRYDQIVIEQVKLARETKK